MEIVGIIDDHPPLWGQYVYGYMVFGGIEELEDIFQEEPFDRLVITSPDIGDSAVDAVKKFCGRRGIALAHVHFSCEALTVSTESA